MKNYKWIIITIVVVAVLLIGYKVFAKPPKFEPVTLCHWDSHKYVEITVDNQGALNGHDGHDKDIIPMGADGCPQPESKYEWSEWSECSAKCGGGIQTRTCDKVALDTLTKKDVKCEGPSEQACNTQACEIDEPIDEPITPIDEKATDEVDKDERPDLDFTQGPNMGTGDGKVKLKWDTIDDCKDVRIKIADDGVFGNGYEIIETEDDGVEWVYMPNVFWAKIRCDEHDSKYSEVEVIRP